MAGTRPVAGRDADERAAARIDDPEDVTHLVLGGGGGAHALAHFGALAALADLDYFVRVESPPTNRYQPPVDYYVDGTRTAGVAGASTGGFVAALLAMGVGVRTAFVVATARGRSGRSELADLLFAPEPWTERHRPTFRGMETTTLAAPDGALWRSVDGVHRSPLGAVADAAGVEDSTLTELVNAAGVSTGRTLAALDATTGSGVPDVLAERLFGGETATYLRNLVTDYGLFSGRALREQFGDPRSSLYDVGLEGGVTPGISEYVAEESTVTRGRDGDTAETTAVGVLGNLTFAQYANYVRNGGEAAGRYRTDLALTGTNLTTRRGRVFSAEETPDVPIADAIRTTMAAPLLFKPTVVPSGDLAGVWVDGGLTNAYPLHAFDGHDTPPTGVLGLRLGRFDPGPVESVVDLTRAVAGRFLDVGTESQIRGPADAARTVDLPVDGVPMASVPGDPDRLRPVLEAGATAVFRYFDTKKPAERGATAVRELLFDAPRLVP